MAERNAPSLRIMESIVVVRGHRVLLDARLADLYGVATKVLVQAVKRNVDRFPQDFMFQLNKHELAALRSQIVTSKASGRGGARYAPYVFTEQGVAMLSSVLNSRRAIAINVEIMRVFVRIREAVGVNRELALKFAELERKVASHDKSIAGIFEAIRHLMESPSGKSGRRIGFV
jgi:hypothetical protein